MKYVCKMYINQVGRKGNRRESKVLGEFFWNRERESRICEIDKETEKEILRCVYILKSTSVSI